MLFVGKIDREIFKCVTNNIITDEVVITSKQVEHIEERHPGDRAIILPFLEKAVSEPDYILEDKEHEDTGLILKHIISGDVRFQMVLRIQTSKDPSGFKNSIISAWRISESRWNNYIRNRNILYKHE